MRPMLLRPVAQLRKIKFWLSTNGEGRRGARVQCGRGEGNEDKKGHGIQLGLKTILDAGEEGAKVGQLHMFDSKLILQRACIVPSDIGRMDPFVVLEDHDLDRVLVDGILVIPFQPDLV